MGQKPSQELSQEHKADVLFLCDIFSQGVVYASQKLKDYLGFEDPQGKFHPATDTLNEIFLINFITFFIEKGLEERITTSKMTKQQSLLFGVDWVWTLFGADKQIKLQFAVQALQLSDLPSEVRSPQVVGSNSEEILTDELFQNKSRFKKLEEFCMLVGHDCLGLFITFGVPGRPKDIRGVVLDSIKRENQKHLLSDEDALKQFILNTENFLPSREMLEHFLSKKNGLKEIGKVYINFL